MRTKTKPLVLSDTATLRTKADEAMPFGNDNLILKPLFALAPLVRLKRRGHLSSEYGMGW
jgi:hypothetical protein